MKEKSELKELSKLLLHDAYINIQNLVFIRFLSVM